MTMETVKTVTTAAGVQPKKVNYLDKQEFLARIVEYRKTVRQAKKAKQERPKIPDHIALSLEAIAKNAAKHPHYARYTFRDQMVSDAVENMIRYFDNFDPRHAKKNPFGYFSMCCIRAFWRRIEIEKEELYGKYKIAQQSGIMDDFGMSTVDGGDGENIPEQGLYDNINEFIAKFEESLQKKREKKAARKALKKKPKGLEKFGK